MKPRKLDSYSQTLIIYSSNTIVNMIKQSQRKLVKEDCYNNFLPSFFFFDVSLPDKQVFLQIILNS